MIIHLIYLFFINMERIILKFIYKKVQITILQFLKNNNYSFKWKPIYFYRITISKFKNLPNAKNINPTE